MTHESNGIDIITALILNDISPLCRYRVEMVLQLKVQRVGCSHLNWSAVTADHKSIFTHVNLSDPI